MTNAATFDRSDFYYEPKVVADVLKRCGVDEFIFSPMALQDVVPIEEVIREARETQAAFGPGAHPFYWVTGPFYDADPDFKILDDGFFEGVKIHELETPWVKERPKDLDRILSVLEERDVPVQFHSGEVPGCYPHELLPFAKRHPKLCIDFAHCCPYKEMIECLKECPNLFTDTSFDGSDEFLSNEFKLFTDHETAMDYFNERCKNNQLELADEFGVDVNPVILDGGVNNKIVSIMTIETDHIYKNVISLEESEL